MSGCKSSCQSQCKYRRVLWFCMMFNMFMGPCLQVRCQLFCQLRRMLWRNCFLSYFLSEGKCCCMDGHQTRTSCSLSSHRGFSEFVPQHLVPGMETALLLLPPLLGQECCAGKAVFVLVTQCVAIGGECCRNT